MTQRKDGRWQENVFIGTVDGVPKYKTVSGKTKKEVKQKALDLKIKNKQGIDILSGDRTLFSFWADAWLESIKDNQTESYFKILSVRTERWKEFFANDKLENIRTLDVQKMLNGLAKSNPRYPNQISSNKTIKEYRSVINRIFKFCLENRVLTFNPAEYTTLPKGKKKVERKPLTNEQINYFIETEHPLQICAMLMIFAGLRRGECLALTWNDVDFVNRYIRINKAVNLKEGIVKEPKTEAGNRIVPMPENLCKYLLLHKCNELLVVTYNGESIKDNNTWERLWRNYIREIRNKYNIDFSTSAHCLRHTYCTLMLESGLDVLVMKEFMGHSNINVTMDVYAHLREQRRKQAADKLNKYVEKM